jgi:CxxC motif-containing protein (DUF1111 family)
LPEGGGLANSFVMQLDGPASLPYGAVLDTAALPDHSREGQLEVRWTLRTGRHADGSQWTLREPHYSVTHLLYGPLPASTILRPRIGPQVYGAGLLESVSREALQEAKRMQPRARWTRHQHRGGHPLAWRTGARLAGGLHAA